MADLAAERKKHVQALRACARACGVRLVRDDAGQERVRAFAAAIDASAGPARQKAAARTAYAAYARSWLAEEVPRPKARGPAARGHGAEFRLRGKSFLVTYNWDFCNEAFPDGSPPVASPEALWAAWRAWKASKKQELGVKQSTSTLERSLRSSLEGRMHIHWKKNLEAPIDKKTRAIFAFHGVLPDVRPTVAVAPTPSGGKKARGKSLLEASNRGHVYVWAPKKGTLFRGTNYKAFEDYRVLGKWLDDLWTDGKLSHASYHDLALQVRVGFAARKRELEQVLAAEREERVDTRLVVVAHELERLKAPARSLPEVHEWESSFLQLDFRWKILLLWGDSASGKSTFAEGLFANPHVITVEESTNLDLKAFDFETHDGIVLDNVNSFAQLLMWRAILQGRNAKSKGGQSATNMFAYPQYLFGVAVVATVDLDAPDGYLMDTEHKDHSKWLVKNTVCVRLPRGEKFYDTSRRPVVPQENHFSLFAQTVKRRRASAADA